MIIGRAWHELAEGKPLSQTHLSLLDTDFPWVQYFKRMLAGYQLERKRYAPTLFHERVYEKENDIKMIIDEVAHNDKGDWWIIERKTAARDIGDLKRSMLASDLQLGLYSAYRKEYAKEWWLDKDRYQGCVYLVTYKPSERRKKKRGTDEYTETIEQFGERLTSSSESVLVENIDERGAIATRDYGRKVIDYAADTYAKTSDWRRVPRQTSSCMRFGRPCPFFTQCHGRSDI